MSKNDFIGEVSLGMGSEQKSASLASQKQWYDYTCICFDKAVNSAVP